MTITCVDWHTTGHKVQDDVIISVTKNSYSRCHMGLHHNWTSEIALGLSRCQ